MEQLSSRVVYRNEWMTVREDVVRRPDGSEGMYGVVEKPDFALVLPRENDGFWMVEQFRYPIGRRGWEFPMGSWSGPPAGDQLDLARSELAEETGLRADSWTHLGRLSQANGFATQGFDVFLATGLRSGPPAREISEQDMVQRFVSDVELVEMLRNGVIEDAASIAALALFHLS